MRKMGSVIGDSTEVGCNSVLYPGTIIGKNTNIYPLTREENKNIVIEEIITMLINIIN
jgi:UDP-3-O-[3-hydroxymyristoyl] glucosamine N-acyltransferase